MQMNFGRISLDFTRKMRQYTISELKAIAESAFNYLKKHFDTSIPRHSFSISREELPNNQLTKLDNFYGNKIVYVDMIKFDEKKLIKKLRNGKVEHDFEDKLPTILDEIFARQVGSILFYANHNFNTSGLEQAQKLTGYYSGMMYANRRNKQPLFLRPYRDEMVYDKARRIYSRFKDTKLVELAKVEDITKYNDLIIKLEM